MPFEFDYDPCLHTVSNRQRGINPRCESHSGISSSRVSTGGLICQQSKTSHHGRGESCSRRSITQVRLIVRVNRCRRTRLDSSSFSRGIRFVFGFVFWNMGNPFFGVLDRLAQLVDPIAPPRREFLGINCRDDVRRFCEKCITSDVKHPRVAPQPVKARRPTPSTSRSAASTCASATTRAGLGSTSFIAQLSKCSPDTVDCLMRISAILLSLLEQIISVHTLSCSARLEVR